MPQKKNKDGYFRSTFVIGKNADGKPERITIRGKTKKEHDEKLAEAKRLHSRGLGLGDTTVYDWAEKWLLIYKANTTSRQQKHYRAKLEYDILPRIGIMRIRDVRPSTLQALLNKYEGRKTETVKKIRSALKQMFERAEIEGIIERTPAAHLELPQTVEKPRRPLTLFERAVVYYVAQYHKDGPYFMTILFAGLRRGEDVALTVGDVLIEKHKIIVRKGFDLEKNTGKEKETKTEAGTREAPIPAILEPFLLKMCDGRSSDAPLFPKADGKFATATACRRRWESFLRQCHIAARAKLYRNAVLVETSPFDDEVTPHYLRHTFGTDLHAAKVDIFSRKYLIGHSLKSSRDVTDIYTKMSEKAFDDIIEQLNEYR